MVYVTDNSITAPNLVGDTALEATGELVTARPWLPEEEQLEATFAYDAVVVEGDIISQNPAAAAAMSAFEPVLVVISLGPAPVAGVGSLFFELGSSLRTTPPHGMRTK
jgi:beta-lactam-binding protein with PASTA domain